jgi:hypothetical protein
VIGFSAMVRAPVFLSVSPRTVQYTSGVAGSVTMSSVICWSDCHQTGSTPTVTYALGSDSACSPGLSFSGATLSWSSSYAGNGVCHVTASASGVSCAPLGSTSALPSMCTVPVNISPGPYVGPGDSAYGMAFNQWTLPKCFSAAYAAPGTNPIWTVIRETDQTYFTANCLTDGDMDVNGLATFCLDSICYAADSSSHNAEVDQSGNSPANDQHAWAEYDAHGSPLNQWRPVLLFNYVNGVLPAWSNSNASDRFFQDAANYTGSNSTGTIGSVAEQFGVGANLNSFLYSFVASNVGSNPVTIIFYPPATVCSSGCSEIYVGPDNFTGGTSIISGTAAGGVFHSNIAVIDGGSSILQVDGTQTTGTLGTANLAAPQWQGGDYGGGSNTGASVGSWMSPTIANSTQLSQLACFDYRSFGIGPSC